MRPLRKPCPGLALAAAMLCSNAAAQEFAGSGDSGFGIFDEVRVAGSFSIQSSSPDGPLFGGQVLFGTFVRPFGNYFLDTLLRPRPHLGVTVATDDGTSQVYGGVTWNFPLFNPVFLEASFGGTVHDGPLDGSGGGESLGCRILFRESIGLGIDVGQHWRIIGSVDHSSHASLCDGSNGGLTHAGIAIGYRF
jgi:lipid A 3-O-deacylase